MKIAVILESMRKRLFIGIALPEQTREDLKKDLEEIPGRMVPPENWHFTLQFLQIAESESSKLELLKQTLSRLKLGPPFSASLKNLGAFPQENSAKLLWVGLNEGAKTLATMADTITQALTKVGFKIDTRPYIPHLTISRFLSPRNVSDVVDKIKIKKHTFTIQEIILYESILNQDTSSHYIHLASYPLY